MKTVEKMKKNAPKFVDDTHVQVTKEFAKNARIFGTAEYKLWKAIKADCPEAEMVLKSIKKNPDKKNDTKNMTYERMAIYIREQDDAATLMVEFKKQIALSKVQTNPYRFVLAWFMQKFVGYDEYKVYFAKVAQEATAKADIFVLAQTSATIAGDEDEEFEFAMAANM
jgi:hypothetical protein